MRYSKDLLESITGNIYTGRLRKVFNVKIPECKIVRINGEIFEIFEYIDGWDSDMGYDLEIPTDQPKQIQFAEDLAMMGIFQFLEGSPGDNNQIMQTGNGDIYLVDSCINMSKSYLDIEHAGLFDESAPGKYRYLLSNKELRAIQIQGLNKIFIDDKFMELLKGLTKERLIEILGIDLLQGEHFIKLVNQIHSRVTYLIDYITEYRKRLAPDKPNKSRFSWIWNRK